MSKAERTFMYHRDKPEGQIFEVSPQGIKDLEADGWVDTPAKLGRQHIAADTGEATWRGGDNREANQQANDAAEASKPKTDPVNRETASNSAEGASGIGAVSYTQSQVKNVRELGRDPAEVTSHPELDTLKGDDLEKHVSRMKKDDVREELDKRGITYPEDASVGDLRKILFESVTPDQADPADRPQG